MTEPKIGIIGGGQLGKMMILEAKKMDLEVIILDPTPDCPAASIADEHLVADFFESEAIKDLAAKTDVLTYEFEHIDVQTLKELAAVGEEIYPLPESLELIQNKYDQKQFLKNKGLPVPEFIKVSNLEDLKSAVAKFGLPLMLKSCTGGYDGKGNLLLEASSELETGFEKLNGSERLLMAEEYIPYDKEVSTIVCRGQAGETVVYPIGENRHEESILVESKLPADISADLKQEAARLGREIAQLFSAVGTFCIELFVAKEQLLVNEIAPRPHNSGHYSFDASQSSQFENHIRAVAGLPLGATDLESPVVMRNILGTGNRGKTEVVGLADSLADSRVKVHLYGKNNSYPGRKMGHLTARADSLELASEKSRLAWEQIEIKGKGD